jgi:hypothetical protein
MKKDEPDSEKLHHLDPYLDFLLDNKETILDSLLQE